MIEHYIPNYCIVAGNIHTQEWNKCDFDENEDAESVTNLINPKDITMTNNYKIETGYTYI